jgi:hypothetical protein
MGATLATADNILKIIYEDKIQEQMQNYTKTAKRIESTSEGVSSKVGGKYVDFPLHVKRNTGIGARRELEALPVAGNQGYEEARVSLAYLYGSIRLSGQSLKLADKEYQSFASVLNEEISGLTRDLSKDYNRQVYGTSVGALMTSSGSYAVNTIPTTNTQYMEVGQIVDVWDSTGVTSRATARTVTAVTKNTSVVVDGAAITTGASGDIVVRTGNLNREITGLSQIVNDTGTLFNVNPSTVPLWKSVMNNNGGTNRPLSESLMITMADDIFTNGGTTTAIFCNLGVRRSYYNLLVQQRRYNNTTKFEGGFSGLAFTTDNGDIPVVIDPDCQPNRMYFLNEKMLKIYREGDWAWMDMDGSRWQRVIGFDAYDATNYTYRNMGTHRRNTHGLLSDITES